MEGKHDPIQADAPEQSGFCGPVSHAAPWAPSWEGRVEHLASYQVARFHALDELLAFMRRVLTEVKKQEDVE